MSFLREYAVNCTKYGRLSVCLPDKETFRNTAAGDNKSEGNYRHIQHPTHSTDHFAMDSDDDDDLLLTQTTFRTRRKETAESRQRTMARNQWEDLVRDFEKEADNLDRIRSLQHQADEAEKEIEALKDSSTQSNDRKRVAVKTEFFYVSDSETAVLEDDKSSKKRRQVMIEDMHDERSSCLGSRSILSFDCEQANRLGIDTFSSVEDAAGALDKLLLSRGDGSGEEITSIVHCLQKALDADMLVDYLMNAGILHLLRAGGYGCLPPEITGWLLRIIRSGGRSNEMADLSVAASEVLITLILEDRVNLSFPEFTLDHFVAVMQCWIDQSLHARTSSIISQSPECATNRIVGFINSLRVFQCALSKMSDGVSPTDQKWCDCLVLVCHAGLHRGTSMLLHLQYHQVFEQLLVTLVEKIKETEGDTNIVIQKTALAICKDINKLGPGSIGTEDADDIEASFCLSAIARMIPVRSPFAVIPSRFACLLKAAVAMKGIELLFATDLSREERFNKVLISCGHREIAEAWKGSYSMEAILGGYCGLVELQCDADIDREAHCLATVECCLTAIRAGLVLLSIDYPVTEPSVRRLFGSSDISKHVLTILSLVQIRIEQIQATANRMSAHAHFRRLELHLLQFNQYILMVQQSSGRGEKRQLAIDSFLEIKSPVQ